MRVTSAEEVAGVIAVVVAELDAEVVALAGTLFVAMIAVDGLAIAIPPVPTATCRPPCNALAHATRRSAPIAPGRQTRIRFLAERDCIAFQLR